MSLVDPIGQLFLRLEGRNQPMHVAGLQVCEVPAGAGSDYVRNLVARMRDITDVQPPFNQRLRMRLGTAFWTPDTAMDMDYHVRHLALPEPGAIRDLLALVSMLHGALLDRSRPLWETTVIEGVTGNRFAVYTKFHHAMMDGVSAMRLIGRFLNDTPDADTLYVPWHAPRTPRKPRRGGLVRSLAAGAKQIHGLPGVAHALGINRQDAKYDGDYTGPAEAPACMLNKAISGSRRVAAQGYDMARIRRVATAHDVTINDVVLAMCATALRHYLLDNDALPHKPLIALVPVSLHGKDSEAGNRVAVIYANLATHIADPAERLHTIARSVDYWKRRYKRLSSDQIMTFTGALSAAAGLNLLSGLWPTKQAFNVVISNIPGPKEARYFGDAPMQGMYPVSIVLDGQALNISLVSYDDSLEFGLIACRQSLPSMQNLLRYLDDALNELGAPATEAPSAT